MLGAVAGVDRTGRALTGRAHVAHGADVAIVTGAPVGFSDQLAFAGLWRASVLATRGVVIGAAVDGVLALALPGERRGIAIGHPIAEIGVVNAISVGLALTDRRAAGLAGTVDAAAVADTWIIVHAGGAFVDRHQGAGSGRWVTDVLAAPGVVLG